VLRSSASIVSAYMNFADNSDLTVRKWVFPVCFFAIHPD